MDKIKIDNNGRLYPMPMTVVGAMVKGQPNYLAVAWVCRVNAAPPMMGVALGKGHHTNKGIREHKEFSVNVPGTDIIEAVDYVGLVSGEKVDKSKIFESFYGQLKHAPMIRSCPLTMECKVINTVDLPADEFFIGEIMGVYTEERYLTDGKLDVRKINPFTLTMPDNGYWSIGEQVGKAWSIGKDFKP
jgi:flavin reductase (DIM6/NTAB) family NADH-FMN oxidoreductase RutF